MGKRDNKDIFENIENSEPVVESHQEEHVIGDQIEVVPEQEPIKEFVPEPLKPITIIPVIPTLVIPTVPKKNPDKLRKIKNTGPKYY